MRARYVVVYNAQHPTGSAGNDIHILPLFGTLSHEKIGKDTKADIIIARAGVFERKLKYVSGRNAMSV